MKKDIRLYTEDELKTLRAESALRWDYLCQSFWYRKFCEEMRKAKIESSEIPEDVFDRVIEKLNSIDRSNIKKRLIINTPPYKFILKSYWEFFGNIHYDDFDAWWKKKVNSLRKRSVSDLTDPDVYESLKLPYRQPKFGSKPFPTPDLFFSSITSTTWKTEFIFVAIPLRDLTIAEIGKQITQIQNKQKKEYPYRPWWKRESEIILHGRKEVDEQKRYLEYFILKNNKELTEEELIEKRKKEESQNNPDNYKARDEIQRMINADVKRAEKIIKNVEKGIFPGKYQPDHQ